MYWGRQAAGLYSQDDQNKAMYGGSSVGRDTAQYMANMRPKIEEQENQAASEMQQEMMRARGQEDHERNLQAAEQQRRMFDSQTQRMGQAQKYGVLSKLLGGRHAI